MRQLITRIDDGLHARLKAKAKAEGRSMNVLVTEAIEASIGDQPDRDRLVARLQQRGWTVVRPPRPARVPTEEDLERAGRGAGAAVSEALDEDRRSRW